MFVDADQDMLARRPGSADGMGLHIIDHIAVDMLGGLAQRQAPARPPDCRAEKKCFSARSAWALT